MIQKVSGLGWRAEPWLADDPCPHSPRWETPPGGVSTLHLVCPTHTSAQWPVVSSCWETALDRGLNALASAHQCGRRPVPGLLPAPRMPRWGPPPPPPSGACGPRSQGSPEDPSWHTAPAGLWLSPDFVAPPRGHRPLVSCRFSCFHRPQSPGPCHSCRSGRARGAPPGRAGHRPPLLPPKSPGPASTSTHEEPIVTVLEGSWSCQCGWRGFSALNAGSGPTATPAIETAALKCLIYSQGTWHKPRGLLSED